MIRLGVVGLGYWGPNLVRCFSELADCKVTAFCDQNIDRLLMVKNRFPSIQPFDNYDELLASNIVDALVIATPTATHFPLKLLNKESTFLSKNRWLKRSKNVSN
jgi:predicted dehydrogenase